MLAMYQMQRYRPRPKYPRRSSSRRLRRLVTTIVATASLGLPAVAVAIIAAGELSEPQNPRPVHIVAAGETLAAIARQNGVTVDEIISANGLGNPDRIYVGQELVMPLEIAEGGNIHVVQAGDTLATIAARYGVTAEAIQQANGISGPNVNTGQQLVIPEGAPSADGPTEPTPYSSYTVKRGDSLFRISLIFGVTVDDLLLANDLANPNAVYPGLELRIPSLDEPLVPDVEENPAEEVPEPSATQEYIIAPGDTLAKIATRYDVTVDGIIAANDLANPNRLYAGQVINLPLPGAPARPEPALTATSHTVEAGESLPDIAVMYGVTLHSLAVANQISNPNQIYPGQVLSIPSAGVGQDSVTKASVGPGLCEGVEVERSGSGYFARPLTRYTYTQRFRAGHPGVDLANDFDTPIYAADGGTVVYAGWNPVGYGNLVVLDHGNGWRTYYAHQNSISVECDEWIPRGSLVGFMGSTGNSTGPHLHFEILRYGLPVNPDGYIRF